MVAERHRLRGLEMGEAGHHAVGMLLGTADQGALQRSQPLVDRIDRAPHPEPEIGRHLVVARAGGVQPTGGGADQLGEPMLDMHVDVLERRILGDALRLIFGGNAPEAVLDRSGILGGDDALFAQHGDMGERGADILPPEALVEADRGVDLAHDGRRAAGEAAAPHAVRAVIVLADRTAPAPSAYRGSA